MNAYILGDKEKTISSVEDLLQQLELYNDEIIVLKNTAIDREFKVTTAWDKNIVITSIIKKNPKSISELIELVTPILETKESLDEGVNENPPSLSHDKLEKLLIQMFT